MAFTQFKNGTTKIVTLDYTLTITPSANSHSEATPYFHVEDIMMIINQSEASYIRMINAKVECKESLEDEEFITKDCRVLVGLKEDKKTLLDQDYHFVALPCPPFDHSGGILMSIPLLA